MLELNEYRKKLEEKLIQKFKEEFHEKLGYYPVVVTNMQFIEEEPEDKSLPLAVLKGYFEPFLPTRYHKKHSLGSKFRYRELTDLRNIYCYLARNMGYSLNEIAKSLNNRDHTTVINCIRKFKDLINTDPEFKNKYIKVINHIKNVDNESPALANKLEVPDQPQPDVHTGLLPFEDQTQ
jgi:hypothetical protein